MIIGICGASGSGKSTLARELQKRMRGTVALIPQDAYYIDRPDLAFEQRAARNYDEPAAFDHDLLLDDVKMLTAGYSITRKGYDYTQHRRADTTEVIQPPDVLILEGIHMFYDARLRELMDLKIYIDVDPDICLLRRVKRDINERGRDVNSIAEQYTSTVRPMFLEYIRNYRPYADLVVQGGGKNQAVVRILAGYTPQK